MAEQFFTTCKFCGKQILMTKNLKSGTWVPCDPEIRHFKSGGGPNTYVTPEGELVRGQKSFAGFGADSVGYRRHRKDCCEK